MDNSRFRLLVVLSVSVVALAGCSQLLGQNDDEIVLMKELFPDTSTLEIPDAEREVQIREKTFSVSASFSYKFVPAGAGSTVEMIAERAAAAVEANGWELVEIEAGRVWCGRSAHPTGDDIVHSVTVKVRDSLEPAFVRVELAESLSGVCRVPFSESPS